MKKYESNSKSQGLHRNTLRFLYHLEDRWWLLLIASSSMPQLDHAVRCVWQRHFPNTRVQFRCCDTRGTVDASEAVQDVTASSRVHLRWNKAASTQPPLWTHSDCVNPGHVAVSLQSRTRFYLLKWWLLSWEVGLSAAVAANFVGGEKCWFIVLFFPQHQQKYGGLWKHLWRHSWFQVKLNNFEVCHKLKLILHFINILYYAITFNIYLI